jgi:uncharacterized protein YgbK (DUF1537 family)
MVYAVLADDMTGAADTGIEFAQAGWRTRALRQAWQAADLRGAEVVVVDTGSRALAAAAAYAAVRRTAAHLAEAGAIIVYKKIDSTLRGHLGVELDAALDACGLSLAVVCPAFPAAGRTLREGVLHVQGVALAQSAEGRDPITPVQESHLPTLLARQTRRPVLHWSRLLATGELPPLPSTGVLVVDALEEDDLARIARAALAAPQPALLAGSAGLARPLAAQMEHAAPPSGQATGGELPAGAASEVVGPIARSAGASAPDGPAPILVVCGSLHPAARAQVRAVQAQCGGAVTVLATPETPAAAAGSQAAAQALAQSALAALQAHSAAAIVATGGDTLESLLAALGAQGVDLERALAPGVPLGRIAGGPWTGLPIVSKAGGFGAPDTLVQAVLCLRGA